MSIHNFVQEVAGIAASGGVEGKKERTDMIATKQVSDVEKEDDIGLGFSDIGEMVGSTYYKPSITDLKLLKDTKQWPQVKEIEKINENTVDPKLIIIDEDERGQQGGSSNEESKNQSKIQSQGSSSTGNKQDYMSGVHNIVLQSLIKSIAEKNDYDPDAMRM